MSKSLQKGILFAVCILLVCALGVTLFIFDGTGGAVTGQEGQASGVADAAANAYEHGTDSGRRPAGTYTSVSTGEAFYNAIKSNTQDILLTGNITLTSTTSTSGNFVWNDNSQCFMQNTPFNYKIYGAGYTITIIGPHTSSQGMQMNSADSHDYGGLISNLQSNGAIYDLKVVITKGFSVETWECYNGTWSDADYWLNVGGLVGYMSGGAVIDNVYVELADSSVRLASFKYNSSGSTSQYVRAGGIVGEMGSGATITNVTVNNKGLLVAGQNSGSGSHSLATERYWGAAGNVVGWAAANGGNITIDNVRTTGNGIIRSYMSANIGVGENSNITTANFYDNFTGTYDSTNTRHNVYLNGETGSNFYVTNVYRKGTSSSAGSGVEETATGLRIANTLTVPSDSAYDIYFDATVSDRNNSLAIAFNQAPAASYEYTLVSGNGTTYENYETTSSAIVFRNLPTAAATWNSGGTFTATLNSELLFNDYLSDIAVYEHGYVADGSETSDGTPISTSAEWDNIFSPTGTGDTSGNYYLTGDIVISGFTGKTFSGTLDGNGNTIYIIDTFQDSYDGGNSDFGRAVGGLAGVLTGTIKNVRVAFVNLGSTNTINVNMSATGTNPRIGLVAGVVNGGTIKNVQAYVENGVTVNGIKAADNSVAMGGIAGYATANAEFTDVTLYLDGTLAPTGSYQYLGGIVGLIDNENGATFTDVAIRGAGTFAGTAGNTTGEPTYYGAIAVIQADSTNITSAYATVNGLIYDFDVTLAGTGGGGQSNNSYSCYYLFTNNYNAGASGGWVSQGGAISGYNGAVSYSNVFVNSAYEADLETYAGQRTNGNAAVGGAVINTVQNKVEGLENPVAAYFNPVDSENDMIFRASGTWDSDRMVILALSDGTVRESVLETPGVNTSAKLVYAPKTLAATANVVQLSLYDNVKWPTAPAALTYSGAEQSFAFTLQTDSGTPVDSSDYTVTYSVKEGNTGVLGGNNLPLNAGTYTATIELTNGMEFIDDGQGTTSPEYSLTVTVAPFKVEGTWTYNGGLTITYGDPVPSNIDQYISVSLTTSAIPGGLSAVTASGFTTDYTPGTAAGTTVNINAGTYAVDSGLKAGNYDFTGIKGSGSVEVQKKELSIALPATEEDPYIPHISAVYGATGDKTAVQGLLIWDTIGSYITGNYNGEEVSFTIDKIYIAATDEESGEFTLAGAEEVADENIASLDANSYLITVTADGGNYTVAEGQFFVYNVTPATLTITGVTFEGGFDGVYDGQAHNVAVQYSGLVGSDVAYNFNITVTGVDGIAVTNAGDYTVTVAADEYNPNYDVTYENASGEGMNEYTVTVEKANYDMTGVTFENASPEYDGTEKTITVSGTLPTGADGIQVTVSYSGTNGTALTNAGSTEITATFATTSTNYNVPEAKTATLTVTPKNVTFAWSVSGEIVEGTAVDEVKAMAAETDNGGILEADKYTFGVDIGDYSESTLQGTAVTFTPSVTFTEEGDAANYNITFSPETEQLTVQLRKVEIGVTEATVTVDYVNGYTTEEQFLANFTTTTEGLTIDSTLFEITVTDGAQGNVTLNGAPLNAGTYTVIISPANSGVTIADDSVTTYTYQVTATVAVISWEADTDLIYNGAEHTLTATVANKLGHDDVTVTVQLSGDNVKVTESGFTYTVTGLDGAAKANYTIEDASNLTSDVKTITPATLNITQTAEETLTRPYDGTTTEATSFLTETYVTVTGGVSGENIYDMLNASLTEGGEIKNAGAYTITVTFNSAAEGAGNYSVGEFTSLEIVYTVTAKTITITFDGYEDLTYNGQERTLTATADFVSGDSIDLNSLIAYTGNVTDGKAVNAGSYTATITKAQIEEQNANYTLAAESATQEFTISPATLTLTQADGAQLSRVYDGTVIEAGAFVSADYFTASGYVDGGDEYALFTAAVAEGLTIQNADSYTINITLNSAAEGADNYTCEPFAISYEVTPIQWTASVTAPEGGLTYDGEDKLDSLVITGDNAGAGLEGAPKIVATVTGGSMVNAGTYTVTLQLQTAEGAVYEGGNFELTAESAEIEIAKRVVEINWAEASDFTYTGAEHTLTATVTNRVGEDVVNATVQLSGNNVNVTEAGFTYTVNGLTGAAAENYTIEGAENLTSETQHISRATLTVQFEGISGLEYTGTEYTVTATATGWQNSEDYNSTLNGLITIDGAGTQVLNAGDYTATITKEALEAALGNYTLAQDATADFTVQPATVNVTVTITGDGVVENALTWSVADAVTVSGNSVDGWTLTSGGTSYTVTVTGADGVASDVLQLTLNGAEYKGTPYGTRVEAGKLGVASTDPNYKVEVTTPAVINIEPDISIEINKEYPVSAVYSKDVTYTADDFADYFTLSDPDLESNGSWAYSVADVEGTFSNVGRYTVTAVFTVTEGSVSVSNSFTFEITPASVSGVALDGEGAYTYGDLTADSTVSVKVTYSDGNTATVNATFTAAATSTGGYVKAGESVVLTLAGDDGANANYAQVDGQTVTVSVSKAGITADISHMDNSAVEGVLTLPYIGSAGYSHNITVTLNGVLGGDVVKGELETEIINAKTYGDLTFALHGDDSNSYEVANAADLSVVVTPKEITVEWSNYDGFTYDGTAKTPTATAEGTFDSDEVKLTVTVAGDNATDTDGTMTAVNAGDYTATVAAFVSGNYKLSAASEQPFSIAKATATLGIDNYQDSVVYNAGAVTVTPTVNGAAADGIVNVTIAYTATGGTEAVSADEIRNAGSYTVTLQISGALNYEDASKDFVITVTPAELTVTTANTSFTYDGSVKGIDRLGVSLSGAVAGDDVSAVIDSVVSGGESAELKNAGSYTVTYRLEGAAAGNYKIIAGGSVGVTIGAKALTFTWNSDQTFTYNGEAQVPGYTLDGVVDGDEVTVTVTVTGGNETEGQAINAGGYTASVADITEGNYSLTGVQTCSFTIGKANLTLAPDSVTFSDRDADKLSAYSQANYVATIKANVTVTGVDDGVFNDFTVTTGASFTGENGTLTVGDYAFTISVAGDNYNDATYTVSVTAQTVAAFTATPSSTTYTGGEITFSFANDSGIQLEAGVQITVSGITFNNASAASVLDAGSYTVTFAVTGNSANNNYWYTVSNWSGSISPATVTANAVTAVYGDVYTALETGDSLQHGTVWQFVTFKNSPVEVTVTVTDATARAGETYLGADTYDVTVTLVSGNYTFAGGSSVASTLQITPKQLNIAAQLPEDLTYTSEGIVIGLEDYASQLVGDDNVTVSMLVDGEPYVAGVTVLGAGQHTVTVTMTDTSGNYQLAAAQQTFTVEKKEVTSSITVSGETIENNSSLEIVHGENARVQNAIDNYLTQNGVEEGEYTLTVTNSAGQAADLDNISAWAPGTYTVNLGLSDNFEGGMTFTIVVQEGTTAQIPDAPVLPSTPLEDGGSSGAANWLFPLIIAIECLIAVALIVAIAVSAARRSKNS